MPVIFEHSNEDQDESRVHQFDDIKSLEEEKSAVQQNNSIVPHLNFDRLQLADSPAQENEEVSLPVFSFLDSAQ